MDRAEAVRKLVNVFRHYGYEGATLARISEATGLGKASLYHHFPQGKKEMAEAVLAHVLQVFQANVLQPLHQDGQPIERLRAMNETLSRFYNNGQDACLLALFTLGESHDLFHGPVQQALQVWIEAVEQLLRDAGIAPAVAQHRAEDAVIQIQGAIVLTRGLKDTAVFERIMQQMPESLLARVGSEPAIRP